MAEQNADTERRNCDWCGYEKPVKSLTIAHGTAAFCCPFCHERWWDAWKRAALNDGDCEP